MKKVALQDLGLMRYKEAWDYQESLFKAIIDQKIANRKLEDSTSEKLPQSHLLFCEHPHVYTLGKSGAQENLLLTEERLKAQNIDYFPINRGGDITYHGPGQIVMYPLFDLDQFFTDIHKYLRMLEEAVILTLKEYGIESGRIKEYTGVWLDVDDPIKARKICAMGVKCSRWVTMHGIAFNINTDLTYFKNIVPCGIEDKGVTSLQQELGKEVDIEEVKRKLLQHMQSLFQFSLV